MADPLVSIIIPLYNAEKYIEETILSAIGQTCTNKEIIIVDDGSEDGSLGVALKYKSDSVKIFEQKNKGASAARNKGLLEASGDFIQFLDADDLLSPNKIASQLELLSKHPGKVAVCSTAHFKSTDDPYKNVPSSYEDSFLYDTDSPADFLINLYGGYGNAGSMVQPNAWLTPKNLIEKAGPWNEFKCPDDDGEFFCRVLLASGGIIYDKNCYNYYRKHEGISSLSSQKSHESLESILLSANLKYQYLKAASDKQEIDNAFAKIFLEIAILSYPQYPELSQKSYQLSKKTLKSATLPTIGGPVIEFIKRTFGWKTARLLQFYLRPN